MTRTKTARISSTYGDKGEGEDPTGYSSSPMIILLVDVMTLATLPVCTFAVQKVGHNGRVIGQMVRPGLLFSFNRHLAKIALPRATGTEECHLRNW